VANGDTQATQPSAGDGVWSAAGYARPVLAGLLLVVVIAGVRAERPAVAVHGPWRDHVLLLAGLLELALAGLLIALRIIISRRPGAGHPAAMLRVSLQRTVVLAMVAAAVLAVVDRLRLHLVLKLPSAHAHGKSGKPNLTQLRNEAAHNTATVTYLLYALLAVLLLAAIAACVVVILRRQPAGPTGDLVALQEDDGASLRQAIESGRAALRALDDAQAAIIACYVAMEASLASAGAARAAAETPDELLARAVESGLLRGAAAARLTELFYEARFSSHTLPPTARVEATRALDAISAELAHLPETRSTPGAPSAGARQ